MNMDFIMQPQPVFYNQQWPLAPSLSYPQPLLISNEMMPNVSIPNKLVKTSFYITSSKLPDQLKSNLIYNLLMGNSNLSKDQILPQLSQFNNMNIHQKNSNTQANTRILFKKEEDERIKKLVKIFGTRHWDLVAQFMEGRTAKQCRDRYSNYLIPGYFQGEWSEEEDELLIKLYKEHGPRWSIIKKSFPNRSSNNIKNRWYYFLHKKATTVEDKEEQMNESPIENAQHNDLEVLNVPKTINASTNEQPQQEIQQENENSDGVNNNENENGEVLIHQENDFFDFLNNNIETENNWILFN